MPLIGNEIFKSSDLRGQRGWAPASVGRSIRPCACPAHAGPRSSAPAGSRQHGVVSSADTACTKQKRDLHAGNPSMTGPTVRPCRPLQEERRDGVASCWHALRELFPRAATSQQGADHSSSTSCNNSQRQQPELNSGATAPHQGAAAKDEQPAVGVGRGGVRRAARGPLPSKGRLAPGHVCQVQHVHVVLRPPRRVLAAKDPHLCAHQCRLRREHDSKASEEAFLLWGQGGGATPQHWR